MKKSLISLALAAAAGSFAMAGGDIAPVAPAPANNWDGFYMGIQAGYNWGDAEVDWIDNTDTADEIPYKGPAYDVDGTIAGIYGGYNWIFGEGWLLGVEGEINMVSGDDTQSTNYENEDDYPGEVKHNWDASLRLRAGKVMGDFLPYVTGGVAWGGFHVKQYAVYDENKIYFDKDMTLTGWTVGAGLEWSISSNVHLRVQYRYTDYGDDSKRDLWKYENTASPEGYFTDGTLDYNAHQVSVGLTFQF